MLRFEKAVFPKAACLHCVSLATADRIPCVQLARRKLLLELLEKAFKNVPLLCLRLSRSSSYLLPEYWLLWRQTHVVIHVSVSHTSARGPRTRDGKNKIAIFCEKAEDCLSLIVFLISVVPGKSTVCTSQLLLFSTDLFFWCVSSTDD